MESSSVLANDNDGLRISDSPRRSPRITAGLQSPVRSVHPDMAMESIHSQADFGHRTADFFDDTSDDDEAPDSGSIAPDMELVARRGSPTKKRQSGPTSAPIAPFASRCESRTPKIPGDREGYQRLSQPAELSQHLRYADSASSSFGGSVDELLPGQHISPPPISVRDHYSSPPQMPRQAHINDGEPLRSSTFLDRPESRQSKMTPSKVDQILNAHQIAHEITLQALMRDENNLDQSLQSFAPLRGNERQSLLPTSLRFNDPRSPRDQTFTPLARPQSHSQTFTPSAPSESARQESGRKVHVVPPPIDTTAPKRSLPQHMVRTPYPSEGSRRKIFEKSPDATPLSSPPASSNSESILTLSIRRSNPNSRPRITTITIPASNDYSAVRNSDNPNTTSNNNNNNNNNNNTTDTRTRFEQHLHRTDYDDEHLFLALRSAHRALLGPVPRFLLARSLSRITVSDASTRATNAGYGWLHAPRSPRALASKGLSDTFSEPEISQAYRNPSLGRARYAFVGWAHRLAASQPPPPPQQQQPATPGAVPAGDNADAELVVRGEQAEGLEFVVSWSLRRILGVLALVLCASVAATLLWVLLGASGAGPDESGAGFLGAGDRVAGGVVLGILVLLMGLGGMGAWLGVSWLVL